MERRISWNGLALAAVFACVALLGCLWLSACGSSTSSTTDAGASNAVEQDDAEVASDEITAAKFKKIKQGMSYKKVVKVIGSEGEEQSSSSVAGEEAVVYQWTSDSFGIASVTFENDKVVSKAQIGLGNGSGPKATKAKYKKVKTGMSLKQVEKVFGGEGELTSDTKIAGYTTRIYTWYGDSLGANCTITFSNGKVSSKAQLGLE